MTLTLALLKLHTEQLAKYDIIQFIFCILRINIVWVKKKKEKNQ